MPGTSKWFSIVRRFRCMPLVRKPAIPVIGRYVQPIQRKADWPG